MTPEQDKTTPDRWTIYVCTGCGQATGRHKDCDAKREAVEVVPADEVDRLRWALEMIAADSKKAELADAEYLRGIAIGALDSQLTP